MKLESVALPDTDPTIDALPVALRRIVARVYRSRAASELGAAQGFRSLSWALEADGAQPEVVALAARAVDDERRHAELCRRVASRYAGRELALPDARPPTAIALELPASLRVAAAVVATSCVSETLGAAYLELCLKRAKAQTARVTCRALLSDEVDHGRIGWAHLAGLAPADKMALESHLPALVEGCLAVFESRIDALPPQDLSAHGCPPRSDARACIASAVGTLVAPGFAHVGLSFDGSAHDNRRQSLEVDVAAGQDDPDPRSG